MFPKCCFQNVVRQQFCPELISKPWKIILFHINTEENAISTEIKGGKLSRSVCQEWWKTERKGFNRKAGKASMERQCHSQLTNTSVWFVWLWSISPQLQQPLSMLPRSRSETYFCPYSSVATSWSLQQWGEGKVWLLAKGLSCAEQGALAPAPSVLPDKGHSWSLPQQGLPLAVPTSLCLLQKDFKGVRDLFCV